MQKITTPIKSMLTSTLVIVCFYLILYGFHNISFYTLQSILKFLKNLRKEILLAIFHFQNILIITSLIIPLVLAFIDFEHKNKEWQKKIGKIIEDRIRKKKIGSIFIYFVLVTNFISIEFFTRSSEYPSTALFFENILPFNSDIIDPISLVPSMIGGYITVYVAFITFILVAVQLASVQFSPRILRMFFPRNPQIFFLSIFFLICITYLVLLPIGLRDNLYRIKDIALLSASVLCIPLFFVFVALLVTKLNVTDITRTIKERVLSEIDNLYIEKRPEEKKDIDFTKMVELFQYKSNNSITDKKHKVYLTTDEKNIEKVKVKNGFIEDYNKSKLGKLNKLLNNETDKIDLKFAVGQYIQKDQLIATFDCADENNVENITELIKEVYNIGDFRSFDYDIQFGIRQLVDIAIKAVSPAVNDPTTCITCIYNITDIILELLNYNLTNSKIKNENPNFNFNEFDFARIIDQSFDQIYTWSKNDVDVTRNIIRSLSIIASKCNTLEELKVICDELIDLDIFHGYLKKLDKISIDEFKEKTIKLNVNLTVEGGLILKEELHYFCCAAFKISNDKHPDIINKVEKEHITKIEKILENNNKELINGKGKHTNFTYEETFKEILEILEFTNK